MALEFLFGVVIPYLAFAIFVVGVIYRIVEWAKSPVYMKIPTTCGQQKSLDWIKRSWLDRIESPYTKLGVIARMIMEIFLFRSLFRNNRYEHAIQRSIETKVLWVFAILFHWSLLIILLRHLRLFLDPVPSWVELLQAIDGFFGIDYSFLHLESFLITNITVLLGLLGLFARRVFFARERTLSLPSDYLALILLLSVVGSGMLMRYFVGVQVADIKEFAVGLVTFRPVVPDVHWLFFVHLTLVSILLAYFPFSKLMHAGGIFFSPTRNMPNDNRARRHINPWNPPYKGITYEEYYEMYKDQLDEIAENDYKIKPEVLF